MARDPSLNRFVVVAPPRSGTGYLSTLLNRCGIPCGHEDVFTPHVAVGARPRWQSWQGDVSWLAVLRLDDIDVPVFHQTRDAEHTVASLIRTGLFDRPIRSGPLMPYQRAILTAAPMLFDDHATRWDRADATRREWNHRAALHAKNHWHVERITVDLLGDVFGVRSDQARRALDETPKNVNTR